MTSPTGSKKTPLFLLKNKRGFTFVEVMVTLVILSLGLVAIFKSYIIALDQMSYLTTRVYASTVLENQISLIERRLKMYKTLPTGFKEIEKLDNGYKTIVYEPTMQISEVSGFNDVFQLDLTLNWEEGRKPKHLKRSAYISDSHFQRN